MRTNRTNFEHGIAALVVQLVIGVPIALLGSAWGWWVGAAAAVAFFVGHEFSQRLGELAAERHVGLLDVPWWHGFTGWIGHDDRIMDVAVPAVLCGAVAVLATIAHHV